MVSAKEFKKICVPGHILVPIKISWKDAAFEQFESQLQRSLIVSHSTAQLRAFA